MPGMTSVLYDYTEAAALLRTTRDTLQRKVSSGRVPHLKFDKRVFFTPEHIAQILGEAERGALSKPRPRPRKAKSKSAS